MHATGDEHDLPAGTFSAWVEAMQGAIRGERASDVPCDGCTACCTSSQFVHIGPDETDTLAHIPAELLFPAPRLPPGHVLLGYDERGHCPMLIDNRCSIYAHRPQTCRTYDCRVFPAAGVQPEADDQADIARRARRWQFGYPADEDRVRHDAVRAAARYVDAGRGEVPEDAVPATATQHAVMAVEIHGAFWRSDARTGRPVVVEPDPEVVRVALAHRGGASRPAISVEPFRAGDQVAVRQLVLDGLEEHWGALDPDLNADLDDLAAAYAEGAVFVARAGERIAGAAALVPLEPEEGEVKRMSVAYGMRRRGVGTALLAALVAEAQRRGWTALRLETSADWDDAVSFYGALGFEPTHFEDGPFGRDIYFRLDLQDAPADG